MAAALLLTGAAATTCTVLHTADLQRGPLPALARAAAPDSPGPVPARPPVPTPTPAATRVSVELTVTGDPRTRTSHARGSNPGHPLLTVDATADQVTTSTGVTTRTRTPVTLIVQERDTVAWQGLLPSERIAAQARVMPATGTGRDTAAALLAQGSPRQLAPPDWAQRLAGRLRAGLRAACAGLSPDARALLPGLVVGDTSAMPDDLDEAFRVTDLVHLTAVSGANLSIVLAVLLGAPARVGTAERGGLAALLGVPLRVSALLGAVLTVAFVTLCRPDPSVLRAAATGLVGLLALAMGRPRRAVPALAGGVLVLLLVDPFLARSYGFLLSALATLGVLTAGRRWTHALHERGWPHHLASGVAVTAAAQAFCAPVTVLLAPRVSLVGIPCNVLAELAITPATLIGFLCLALAPFSAGLARFLAELAALPTEWLALVARSGAALPGAELDWTPGWPGTVSLALAVLAACYAVRLLLPAKPDPEPDPDSDSDSEPALLAEFPPALGSGSEPEPAGRQIGVLSTSGLRTPVRRRVRALVAAVLAVGFLLLLLRPAPLVRIATGWPPTGARLIMCSVGQGDLLVLPVTSGPGDDATDTAVVVDTGPDPAAADACLRDLGITRVPMVLLTHFHADHSEGLPGVLRDRSVGAIETTTVATPPGEVAKVTRWAAQAGVPLLRAVPGEHRVAGPELSWDVLWPVGELGPATPGANNASIALLVRAGGLRLALLGDLEPAAQAELLSRVRPGPVDVLKVAHHGSANQDWELARALHPRLVLISVGADNPYGHPAARTVDRLRAQGATVLRTDRSGDIAVLGDTPAALHALTHPHQDSDGDDAGAVTGNSSSDGTSTTEAATPPRATPHALPPRRPPLPAAPRPSRSRAPPGPPATGRPRRRPHRPGRPGPAPTGRAGATVRAAPRPPPRPRRGRQGRAAADRRPRGHRWRCRACRGCHHGCQENSRRPLSPVSALRPLHAGARAAGASVLSVAHGMLVRDGQEECTRRPARPADPCGRPGGAATRPCGCPGGGRS
ncbi:ComEC/Rec2 family competence protein [Kitasatospora sp. NBC_01266]|uniref:ComEC/Rec2 family competence protein n=1 Tax=Kitasatospora sp. NBC_01266 TaxID=2903572 RepID=UPI002E323078|nr:ComEC/Rec2 family competence protein [Kitasatospora sp. NBC_01266]